MKNPYEVLRSKEQEIEQLRNEVEALRITARLLSDDEEEEKNTRQVIEMP
jgi:hypothetical protein